MCPLVNKGSTTHANDIDYLHLKAAFFTAEIGALNTCWEVSISDSRAIQLLLI